MTIKRHGVGPRLSQAVVHGDTVYLAGMVAADPSADAKGQTQQILKKIDETLAAVGSHKSKILAATVYVANMGVYNDMNAAWDALGRSRQHSRARDRRGAAGFAQVPRRAHCHCGHPLRQCVLFGLARLGPRRPRCVYKRRFS